MKTYTIITTLLLAVSSYGQVGFTFTVVPQSTTPINGSTNTPSRVGNPNDPGWEVVSRGSMNMRAFHANMVNAAAVAKNNKIIQQYFPSNPKVPSSPSIITHRGLSRERLRELSRGGNKLYSQVVPRLPQSAGGYPQGVYDPVRKRIHLARGARRGVASHEAAHHWLSENGVPVSMHHQIIDVLLPVMLRRS